MLLCMIQIPQQNKKPPIPDSNQFTSDTLTLLDDGKLNESTLKFQEVESRVRHSSTIASTDNGHKRGETLRCVETSFNISSHASVDDGLSTNFVSSYTYFMSKL